MSFEQILERELHAVKDSVNIQAIVLAHKAALSMWKVALKFALPKVIALSYGQHHHGLPEYYTCNFCKAIGRHENAILHKEDCGYLFAKELLEGSYGD